MAAQKLVTQMADGITAGPLLSKIWEIETSAASRHRVTSNSHGCRLLRSFSVSRGSLVDDAIVVHSTARVD